jgi:Uncharacterised protein family (UPF0156).
MNITLTTEQEKYVQSQLEEGKYNSVEQLISQALQLLEEQKSRLRTEAFRRTKAEKLLVVLSKSPEDK